MPKTEEILYQKTHSSPRLPPKVILKNAWQVQHEDHHQRGTSAGQLAADKVKMERKIDFRIQGVSHAAVEQEEDSRTRLIRRLVHQVMRHPNKDASIADLQSKPPYNPLSEESKQMIHTMGNEECIEPCEISPKVQCFCCLRYWTEGVVYCTCGCLVPTEFAKLEDGKIRRIDNP